MDDVIWVFDAPGVGREYDIVVRDDVVLPHMAQQCESIFLGGTPHANADGIIHVGNTQNNRNAG